jgi:hypothetical protein
LPPLEVIDRISGSELNAALEKALNDPDVNITGAARSNLLRTLSDTGKRTMLKQYLRKKDPKNTSATALPVKRTQFADPSRPATASAQTFTSSHATYKADDAPLPPPPQPFTSWAPPLPPRPPETADSSAHGQSFQMGLDQFIAQLADRY